MPSKEQGYKGSQAKKSYFRTERVNRGHTLIALRFEKLKRIMDQKNMSRQNILAQHKKHELRYKYQLYRENLPKGRKQQLHIKMKPIGAERKQLAPSLKKHDNGNKVVITFRGSKKIQLRY